MPNDEAFPHAALQNGDLPGSDPAGDRQKRDGSDHKRLFASRFVCFDQGFPGRRSEKSDRLGERFG